MLALIANLKVSTITFAIAGGLFPAFFWLWFWLQEDKKRPEPSRLIAKTFIIGGFSIVLAFCLERLVSADPLTVERIQASLTENLSWSAILLINMPLVLWALIEEATKYIAARVAALKNVHIFDEPIDAMVYMITAALGFASIENFLFLLNAITEGSQIGTTFLFTGNLRFLGATLLHVVTSAVLGSFIGLAFYSSRIWKFLSWIIGLFIATVLHVLFNFFIITNEGKNIFNVLLALWLAALVVIFLFEIIKRISHPQNFNIQTLTIK